MDAALSGPAISYYCDTTSMMLQAFFVILLVIQEMGYTARHGTEEKDGRTEKARRGKTGPEINSL